MVKLWFLTFVLISAQDTITTHAVSFDNRTACDAAGERLKGFEELRATLVSCVPAYPNPN